MAVVDKLLEDEAFLMRFSGECFLAAEEVQAAVDLAAEAAEADLEALEAAVSVVVEVAEAGS